MQAAFKGPEISIHALLAESDPTPVFITSDTIMISIPALLAESDVILSTVRRDQIISIHALLAESDQFWKL